MTLPTMGGLSGAGAAEHAAGGVEAGRAEVRLRLARHAEGAQGEQHRGGALDETAEPAAGIGPRLWRHGVAGNGTGRKPPW